MQPSLGHCRSCAPGRRRSWWFFSSVRCDGSGRCPLGPLLCREYLSPRGDPPGRAFLGPAGMTRWEDLSSQEKTAMRKLAKGEVHEVSARMIRRLAALGLADGSTEGRLTPAGLEIYRARPIGRSK